MRLAAQMKGGFYPAPPEAVALAASFLRPPPGRPFAILDPCAGEGAALGQLAQALGCLPEATYAIELDDDRAERLKTSLPGAHVLAPASFFGCRASRDSFSLLWLNPPFDDGYAGNRVEDQFLRDATDWLMPGGILAFVCPEDTIDEYSDARAHFGRSFQHFQVAPFPEDCRRFGEVIVFGQKRHRPRAEEGEKAWQAAQAPPGFVYHLPSAPGPRIFQKVEPTEPELARLLAGSPLRSHLATPPADALPAPPLALGTGHVALLLAGGHLDGVVQPEAGPPHVVRGTCRKREFVAGVTETENADGSTTRKTTLSQRIELVVRTVDATGRLCTYLDAAARA